MARNARRPDYKAEKDALKALARGLATSPGQLLQTLADTAMAACKAHSAGISLVEDTLPRMAPETAEVLRVPICARGKLLGTLWVISHDERQFDHEDLRIASSLAAFAATAYDLLSSLVKQGRSIRGRRSRTQVRKRILLVDDDGDAADALALALRRMGQEVYTASDANDAVGLAREIQPEVALIDVAMPQTDGHEVGRQLRQALGPSALLVAMTKRAEKPDALRATAAGFDHCLAKPLGAALLDRLLA